MKAEQKSTITFKEQNTDMDPLQAENLLVSFKINDDLMHVLDIVKEWAIQKYQIGWKSDKMVLHYIYKIQFPQLIFINLPGNNIQSIEGLCRLFPNLQQIYFCNNRITNIRLMKKVLWKNFHSISFNDNRINDPLSLRDFSFVGANLRQIFIQSYEKGFQYSINDIRFIAKIKNTKFEKLYVRQDHRIQQKPIKNLKKHTKQQ